jgi:hypothetical protein
MTTFERKKLKGFRRKYLTSRTRQVLKRQVNLYQDTNFDRIIFANLRCYPEELSLAKVTLRFQAFFPLLLSSELVHNYYGLRL